MLLTTKGRRWECDRASGRSSILAFVDAKYAYNECRLDQKRGSFMNKSIRMVAPIALAVVMEVRADSAFGECYSKLDDGACPH